jgi:hypothetical protein
VICLAPRARDTSVRPRRQAGASVRPLNFTVSCHDHGVVLDLATSTPRVRRVACSRTNSRTRSANGSGSAVRIV